MNQVSIIMPVYNVETYLPKAIESALNQTSDRWGLILVNDGSTDQSGEICDHYKAEHPERITVIHQNNRGSGEARNTGLEAATGAYIYFADPDDFFAKDLIKDNLEILDQSHADFITFGYIEEKGTGTAENLPNIPQIKDQEMFRKHFRNFNTVSPYALWNKMYKKSYLDEQKIRFGSERLGQDAVFNIKIFENINTVSVNRKAYYHYLAHESSSVNRYRSDRFDLELNVAEKFEQLLISWGRQEEFYDLIQENYWDALYTGLIMAAHEDNPLTEEEKLFTLDMQLNNEKIRFYVDEEYAARESNPFRKQLTQFLLKREFNKAIKLMKFRNQFASRFSKLFSWIRKPLITR